MERMLGPIPKGDNLHTEGTHWAAVLLCKTLIPNINRHLLAICMHERWWMHPHKTPLFWGKSSVMLSYHGVEKEWNNPRCFVSKNCNSSKKFNSFIPNRHWFYVLHYYYWFMYFTDYITDLCCLFFQCLCFIFFLLFFFSWRVLIFVGFPFLFSSFFPPKQCHCFGGWAQPEHLHLKRSDIDTN